MRRHVARRRCGANGKASFRLFRYNMRLDNNNRKDAMACNILKMSVECTAKELVAEVYPAGGTYCATSRGVRASLPGSRQASSSSTSRTRFERLGAASRRRLRKDARFRGLPCRGAFRARLRGCSQNGETARQMRGDGRQGDRCGWPGGRKPARPSSRAPDAPFRRQSRRRAAGFRGQAAGQNGHQKKSQPGLNPPENIFRPMFSVV